MVIGFNLGEEGQVCFWLLLTPPYLNRTRLSAIDYKRPIEMMRNKLQELASIRTKKD
jgi:hypothetical protein